MNPAPLSYRIWFSPRNNSSLLCKSLEQIAISGKPGEYLGCIESTSLLVYYQVDNYGILKQKIWSLLKTVFLGRKIHILLHVIRMDAGIIAPFRLRN